MFRFTQEPSSGSNFVLSYNYSYDSVVLVVNDARLHNRLVCRHNIDHVINDEHNRIIIVVLAKHKITPWWWFLREPKHVGAIVGILIVFNIPVFL